MFSYLYTFIIHLHVYVYIYIHTSTAKLFEVPGEALCGLHGGGSSEFSGFWDWDGAGPVGQA